MCYIILINFHPLHDFHNDAPLLTHYSCMSSSISLPSQCWCGRFQTASLQRLSRPPPPPIDSATDTADLGPATAVRSSLHATARQALALPGQLAHRSFDEQCQNGSGPFDIQNMVKAFTPARPLLIIYRAFPKYDNAYKNANVKRCIC